ncbi:hypothetical protein Tco_0903144 [Tanacetum coccineum]
MMKRVDDFVKSEEAFKNMKLPKGEHPEKGTTTQFRGSRPPLHPYRNGPPKLDDYNLRDHYQPYVPPRAPDKIFDNKRHDHQRQEVNHLRLNSLTKLPSEILGHPNSIANSPLVPQRLPSEERKPAKGKGGYRYERVQRAEAWPLINEDEVEDNYGKKGIFWTFLRGSNATGRLFRGDRSLVPHGEDRVEWDVHVCENRVRLVFYRACHDELPTPKGNRHHVRLRRTRIECGGSGGKEGAKQKKKEERKALEHRRGRKNQPGQSGIPKQTVTIDNSILGQIRES